MGKGVDKVHESMLRLARQDLATWRVRRANCDEGCKQALDHINAIKRAMRKEEERKLCKGSTPNAH